MNKLPWDEWKGDASQDALWEEAYESFKWKYGPQIEALMKRYQLTVIEAMKMRFKWHLGIARSGQIPPNWALESVEEKAKREHDLAYFWGGIQGLLAELGTLENPEDIFIDNSKDPELNKKRKK